MTAINQEVELLMQSFARSNRIVQRASREQLAECVQILALSVAALSLKYGETPTILPLAADRPECTDEGEAKLLVAAFRILSDALKALLEKGPSEMLH